LEGEILKQLLVTKATHQTTNLAYTDTATPHHMSIADDNIKALNVVWNSTVRTGARELGARWSNDPSEIHLGGQT